MRVARVRRREDVNERDDGSGKYWRAVWRESRRVRNMRGQDASDVPFLLKVVHSA